MWRGVLSTSSALLCERRWVIRAAFYAGEDLNFDAVTSLEGSVDKLLGAEQQQQAQLAALIADCLFSQSQGLSQCQETNRTREPGSNEAGAPRVGY